MLSSESFGSKMNRFVKQYSPSCPHCRKIAPAWQTLYEYYYVSFPVNIWRLFLGFV